MKEKRMLGSNIVPVAEHEPSAKAAIEVDPVVLDGSFLTC
jgi:hypothetical protein